MGKKDIILFVTIFCVLALIVAGTYAYWQWESDSNQNPSVVFNTVEDIDDFIYYDGGNSYFVGNFQASNSHCGGKGNALTFYVKNNAPEQLKRTGYLTATIMMDINSIASAISDSNYVKWAVTEGNSCGSPLEQGTFNGKSANSTITLLSGIAMSETVSKYTVWVWVDSAGGSASLNNLAGQTIDVNVWTQIEMNADNASASCFVYLNGTTRTEYEVSNGVFTIPSGYKWYYLYDEVNDCASQFYSVGESIDVSCGMEIFGINETMPPDC